MKLPSDHDAISAKLISIISSIIDNEKITITGKSSLLKDLALSSIKMVELILTIERELNIEFDFESFDYQQFKTIEKLAEFLSHYMSTKLSD